MLFHKEASAIEPFFFPLIRPDPGGGILIYPRNILCNPVYIRYSFHQFVSDAWKEPSFTTKQVSGMIGYQVSTSIPIYEHISCNT